MNNKNIETTSSSTPDTYNKAIEIETGEYHELPEELLTNFKEKEEKNEINSIENRSS